MLKKMIFMLKRKHAGPFTARMGGQQSTFLPAKEHDEGPSLDLSVYRHIFNRRQKNHVLHLYIGTRKAFDY